MYVQGQSSTNEKLPDEYFPLVAGADAGLSGVEMLRYRGTIAIYSF